MSKIVILHLSDLHISHARLNILKPVLSGLFTDLDKLKREKNITPDLIFFSGDLIEKGERADEEFKLVSTHVVEPLLDKLNLNQDRFVSIPGNHEIDRGSVCEEVELGLAQLLVNPNAFSDYYKKLKDGNSSKDVSGKAVVQAKLSDYFKFAAAYNNAHAVEQNFFYSSYKIPVGDLSIGVVGFNSAWRCSQHGNGDGGRLIIGRDVIEDAARHVEGCDLKIALCHHPFKMLTEWDSEHARRLVAREFDLLLTGHIHESDLEYFSQTFGHFYVSTSGCLGGKRDSNFYSIVELDLGTEEIVCHLRKWYSERREFDQETEKAENGVVTFGGFRPSNPEIAERIALHELREKLRRAKLKQPIVNPLEGVVEMDVSDVFVEPLLSDVPTYGGDTEEAKFFGLGELLDEDSNVVFYGRAEYGKTLLMASAELYLLSNDRRFDITIPVTLKFDELPKKNANSIIHLIRRGLCDLIPETKIEALLEDGKIIILLDDFNDKRAESLEAKCKTFWAFHEKYPKCRYILSATEYLSQAFHTEAFQWAHEFKAEEYYIWSFNTSRIRQLLTKIGVDRGVEIEPVLEQILFYFEQLQMPVTPLAVTLFIGVLFRDKNRKNIQNEAYLVENYLETILEKLGAEETTHELDFREKESFLAHIAYRMLQLGVNSLDRNVFEREKLDYFEALEEDVPKERVFLDFFNKGILSEADGTVTFKLRFWFDFFLAKAMEKDESKRDFLLGREDFLKYSTALSYKAGLSRNDSVLLKEINNRAAEAASELGCGKITGELVSDGLDGLMIGAAKEIDTEIRSKSNTDDVDTRRDKLLRAAEKDASQDQSEAEDKSEQFVQLLTLLSDVLRNTREIDPLQKRETLRNCIHLYASLVRLSIQTLSESLVSMGDEQLERFLFKRILNKKAEARLDRIVAKSQQLIYQIVPVSIALYMSDHLGNPKLERSLVKVIKEEEGNIEKLFGVLLLCRMSLKDGVKALQGYVSDSRSTIGDFVGFVFLRVYAMEHVLSQQNKDRVIEVLAAVREKYRPKREGKEVPVFITDTFRSDFEKRMRVEREKRASREK